ncbi:MAG: LolA-related protein [Dokdonella sp.]
MAVDADWIVQKIARPVPARKPFVEARNSSLLESPQGVFGNFVLALPVARQTLSLARTKA